MRALPLVDPLLHPSDEVRAAKNDLADQIFPGRLSVVLLNEIPIKPFGARGIPAVKALENRGRGEPLRRRSQSCGGARTAPRPRGCTRNQPSSDWISHDVARDL